MSGLPRELLKWIQSLDLSYSVKNAKRDFANGFLIGEILNRYFPSDIQMHSFDNGAGLQRRIGNWDVLERFFLKMEYPITRAEIEGVLYCQDGAVPAMLSKLYNILTGKSIKAPAPLKMEDNTPAFARPTATTLVRQKLKDPKLQASSDMTTTAKEALKIITQHEEMQRVDRTTDRVRYSPVSSPVRGASVAHTPSLEYASPTSAGSPYANIPSSPPGPSPAFINNGQPAPASPFLYPSIAVTPASPVTPVSPSSPQQARLHPRKIEPKADSRGTSQIQFNKEVHVKQLDSVSAMNLRASGKFTPPKFPPADSSEPAKIQMSPV